MYPTYTKKYVPRRVEAGGIDAAVVDVIAVRDDTTREPWYRTLQHLCVARFVAGHRVHYHEVYRRLWRSTDLLTREKSELDNASKYKSNVNYYFKHDILVMII